MSSSLIAPLHTLVILVVLAALYCALKLPFAVEIGSVFAGHVQEVVNSGPVINHSQPHTILVIHKTTITVSRLDDEIEDVLQENERLRLTKRLRRDKGKWESTHPRYQLLTALKSYLLYKDRSMADFNRWRKLYRRIPKRQRAFIESRIHYGKKINSGEHLVEKNAELADAIVQTGLDFYDIPLEELKAFMEDTRDEHIPDEKTSVVQAMKHFVRDWSAEGTHEREPTIPCILHTLQEHVPAALRSQRTEPVKVLVPGAGLGRLAHEIAALGGFRVTANERSPHMNLAYRHLLTLDTAAAAAASFHPFVDWWSHQASTANLFRAVAFPDAPGARLLSPSSSSSVTLVEGDFTTAFNDAAEEGAYDAVATLFFIDTARNALAYLETMHRLLAPGGVWVNFGPLMWGAAPLLQLSLDELVALAEGVGFEFLEPAAGEEEGVCGEVERVVGEKGARVRGRMVPYGFDERALARNAFEAQFWVAVKR